VDSAIYHNTHYYGLSVAFASGIDGVAWILMVL
jgi:hypothetical protein